MDQGTFYSFIMNDKPNNQYLIKYSKVGQCQEINLNTHLNAYF